MNTNNRTTSTSLFVKANKYIPGGVNSPVRAFKSVGGDPIFIQKAKGAYLYDFDHNAYIDYINSWGPMILGHGHDDVIQAIKEKVEDAISFGTPTLDEINIAELICEITKVDLVRLVCSGTEACMSAIRLARGYTKKNKFIKFEGCYHGHADAFLVKAGSGLATFNIQNVPGVTKGAAQDTLIAPFNDLEEVSKIMAENADDMAAIIIEPVAGNMGCIPPKKGFLEGLRKLCDEHNALLIFDEVMTGFRLAPGGVQELYNIEADLVTYGKVIGGGMPIGAFGGKREIMEHIAPLGQVYQAGTLSGNPLAVAAGFATLSMLKNQTEIYKNIAKTTQTIKTEMATILTKKGIPHTINQEGSMMSIHFAEHAVVDFETAQNCDIDRFKKFFHHMLNNGVYLPPSAYETWFISKALTNKEIEQTIKAAKSFEK